MQLTEQQKNVIQHHTGHARVMAVAGSGKTTTLVHRVLHLLAQGAHPRRILVLMYNKAAREDFARKLRLSATDGGMGNYPLPDVRTFHSIGHKLCQSLRSWGVLSGRQLIQEGWPYEKLVREAIHLSLGDASDQLQRKALDKDYLEAFLQFTERVKADLISPDDQFQQLGLPDDQSYFIDAFGHLEEIMAVQGVMTFSDLIYRPVMAAMAQPELTTRISDHMDHVIVDEYQDINPIQQYLLTLLSGSRASVMVVGDVDQCIYEWRGARPEFMLSQFSAEFSPCQSYSLNYSFRYGHALSLCANHVISHNRQRDNQLCLSVDDHAPTDIRVLKEIGDLTACFSQSDDFQSAGTSAVLVRSWSLSVPVQLHFLREGIPFRLMQQSQFVFNQPMINQFLTYFRLVCQPVNQPVSSDWLVSCLSFPPLFLSNREQQNVVSYVQQQGINPDAICDGLNLKPYGKKRLKKRLNFILHLSRLSPDQPAGSLVIDILKETDAWEMIDKAAATREQSEEKKKTLQALAAYIRQQRCSISQFLSMIDEQQQSGGSLMNRSGVTITTVHGAKGLEWDRVVLAGLAEGHFPCYQNLADFGLKDEESERRLFYVALTRAKRQLLLLADNGLNDDSKKKRSRFLSEMQLQASYSVAELLHNEQAAQAATGAVESDGAEAFSASVQVERPELIQRYLKFFNSAIKVTAVSHPAVAARTSYLKPVVEVPYRVGDQLVHKAFGEGILLEISAEQSNRITVEFKNGDKKVLLADRAPLNWMN